MEALKWLNIAEANGNKQAAESRRLIEGLITPEQIAEAKKRADDWSKGSSR